MSADFRRYLKLESQTAMTPRILKLVAIASLLAVFASASVGAEQLVTKDEAVDMVKTAVAFIKELPVFLRHRSSL